MKRISLVLLSLRFLSSACAQLPDTDIFVADMKLSKDSVYFSTPENITNRSGYDNHPYFAANGTSLFYVADSAQCDVRRYLFASKVSARITNTPESEFSPGLTPDGKSMTVVRIDTDSSQHAYLFPINNPKKPKVINGTDSIGYYCWVNDSMLAMFIVGPPNTLQILNRKTQQRKKIADNIGRCMKMSADKTLLYFIIKHSDTDWRIHTLNIKDYTLAELSQTIPGSEDFVVLKDGTLLMGLNSYLFARNPKKKRWKTIADFTESMGQIYRIAVNPQENKIAFVGTREKKH